MLVIEMGWRCVLLCRIVNEISELPIEAPLTLDTVILKACVNVTANVMGLSRVSRVRVVE